MKGKKKQKNFWPLIFGILLTGYAVFTLLDAFVLPRDLVVLESAREPEISENSAVSQAAEEAEQLPEETEQQEPIVTQNSYQSKNISIPIETIERYNTQVYVADIQLADTSFLKTALAGNTFGRNVGQTTSEIAKANDAILAVNGDYYGFRDRGFVMREGYLYRDTVQGDGYEDLVI